MYSLFLQRQVPDAANTPSASLLTPGGHPDKLVIENNFHYGKLKVIQANTVRLEKRGVPAHAIARCGRARH